MARLRCASAKPEGCFFACLRYVGREPQNLRFVRGCLGRGNMADDRDQADVGFASFRQQFANGPQRRRLGYSLSHEDAVRILNDPERLADEYGAWRMTVGRDCCSFG
jgi:hypothetical protein